MLITLPSSRGLLAPSLATVVGISASAVGTWLTGMGRWSRLVLPFSAGALLGVALFGLLPELAFEAGWSTSLLLAGAGYGILFVIDHYVYAVCPSCSHDHNHATCADELHGFAVPLVLAAALHSFIDGWSVATAETAVPLGLRVAVPLAVALHKIPEGLALGGIMRGAVHLRAHAFAWCVLAESCTLVGGGAGLLLAPHLGTGWTLYPLGLTAGWLAYLGYHAVHEEWKRRGPAPAFVSALTGICGAAVIQRGAEVLFR